MPHNIIDIRRNLDCVAANYAGAVDSARALKDTCNTADASISPAAAEENPNAESIHETLENIQLSSGEWCSGTNLSEGQLCEALDDYNSELEGLLERG